MDKTLAEEVVAVVVVGQCCFLLTVVYIRMDKVLGPEDFVARSCFLLNVVYITTDKTLGLEFVAAVARYCFLLTVVYITVDKALGPELSDVVQCHFVHHNWYNSSLVAA